MLIIPCIAKIQVAITGPAFGGGLSIDRIKAFVRKALRPAEGLSSVWLLYRGLRCLDKPMPLQLKVRKLVLLLVSF